ncbi:TRAP transporter small permease subunit [Streptomonospora sp. PA3]|uniref:TRAP transporter small permease n=1 Tax=Streptomonospora sp. PA3 TaxID=2607326 RepID=UPI0012DEE875|nr:TRAP transporter small permease subunit [Streptomonospora sp. PA3]MUL41760.1 TRAP transporter small permease subunit [Streptomonospora sp. PA3]
MTDTPEAPGDGPPRARPAALRWLEAAELTAGVALLAMIFALMLTQALQRHLPVSGWVWTGELARLGLVWLSFSLVGYLLGRDEHITLKLIDFAPQAWLRRGVWIAANLVVAAVCAAFVAEAVELVFGGSPMTTPALGIPTAWVYVIPLVGLVLAALRAAANAFLAGPPHAAEALPADTGEGAR